MTTPARKLVHWGSEPPSMPSSPSPSDNSIVSTSSLEYVNSQLISHGFAPSPGLCLDGVSNQEQDKVVKCLLDMLGQRMRDMSRTERLTTDLRTLRYDHDRLTSMYQTSSERAETLERELNGQKSRLAALQKQFQTSETNNKNTNGELSRTRLSLQAVRAAHQSELKRRDKEIERMTERWSKIADSQAKVTAAPSGLRCANLAVVDGSYNPPRGQGFMEVALDKAEKARAMLAAENIELKELLLCAVNEARQELPPMTIQALFPVSPPNFAKATVLATIDSIRGASTHTVVSTDTHLDTVPLHEHRRILGTVEALQTQLRTMRKHAESQAAETQVAIDSLTTQSEVLSEKAEQDRVMFNLLQKRLEDERQLVSQDALTNSRERAELEAERRRLEEEKRSWQAEITQEHQEPVPSSSKVAPSPRKSPQKRSPKVVRAGGPRKASRTSKKTSLKASTSNGVVPPFETEFILPEAPQIAPGQPQMASLLPTSFVLPPPSPHASLPSRPAILTSMVDAPLNLPTTPQPFSVFHRPVPIAKPHIPRMTHAYSPAKPSPLSRILMLGDSPNLDTMIPSLETLLEFGEPDRFNRRSADDMFPEFPSEEPQSEPRLTLAQELGVSESPPESPILVRPGTPLIERKVQGNVARRNRHGPTTTTKGRPLHSTGTKGKGLAARMPKVGPKVEEKENSKSSRATSGLGTSGAIMSSSTVPHVSMVTSRVRLQMKLPVSTSGPRRVPIDSTEAPPRRRND